MNLVFDKKLAKKYTSASQKARVLSEGWVADSIFCPNCGCSGIKEYENNRPVADFFCKNCSEEYELKSKQNTIGSKIPDGAYSTMLKRLASSANPNFFFLNYSLLNFSVNDFFVIPKHFFVPEIIEKRKPLASTARRAGWVGCNILLKSIPESGKVFFVRNRRIEKKAKVVANWQRTLFLREEKEISARGWLIDVMRVVEKIRRPEFMLDDVYGFEKELSLLHPGNKHVKDKIRQQLQVLRDKGFLRFHGRGSYGLIHS